MFMQSLTAGQVVYVRADGQTAVLEADANYAVPPYPGYAVVEMPYSASASNISAIASNAAKLYIREPMDFEF
jgi:hypothetical protein